MRNSSGNQQPDPTQYDHHAEVLASTGDYDAAIELHLLGVQEEPDEVGRHQALRELALRRKAIGGRPLSLWRQIAPRWRRRDAKAKLVDAARALAHDPGNVERLAKLARVAAAGGFHRTAAWAEEILAKTLAARG